MSLDAAVTVSEAFYCQEHRGNQRRQERAHVIKRRIHMLICTSFFFSAG
jgi:hypothetical protein